MPMHLWSGTDESFHDYEAALVAASKLEEAGTDAVRQRVLARGGVYGDDGTIQIGEPYVVMDESVAMVTVEGMLLNGNAGIMQLFGSIGYEDIKYRLNAALGDQNVKSILIVYRTPGGHANGCPEMAEFIRNVDAQKPVVSYADNEMCSGGYWMGVSGRAVFGNALSASGSVGVALVHTSTVEAMKQAGIEKKVFRSGQFKMLGSSFEPLSEQAEAMYKEMVAQSASIFTEYVAGRRNVTVSKFESKMGQGRVMLGGPAEEAGLIDKVMTLAEALAYTKSLDKGTIRSDNPRNPTKEQPMKLAMSAMLALLGGSAASALPLTEASANSAGTVPDAATQADLLAEAIQVENAFKAQLTTAASAAVAPVQAKLDETAASLLQAAGKLQVLEAGTAGLTAKLAAADALVAKAEGVTLVSLQNMTVALGGTAESVASLKGDALMAAHAETAEKYKAKFPGGSIAATSAGGAAPKTVAANSLDDQMMAALVNSAPKS